MDGDTQWQNQEHIHEHWHVTTDTVTYTKTDSYMDSDKDTGTDTDKSAHCHDYEVERGHENWMAKDTDTKTVTSWTRTWTCPRTLTRSRTLSWRTRIPTWTSTRTQTRAQSMKRHFTCRVNRMKENAYWLTCSSTHSGQPRKLWKIFSQIMGLDTAGALPMGDPTSQDLMDYFVKKIETIRNSTASTAADSTRLPPATAVFDSFRTYNVEEVCRIITSAPSKSCSLDPIPTTILKEFLPELLPCITELCNRSLKQG